MSSTYVSPRIEVLGSLHALTLAPKNPGDPVPGYGGTKKIAPSSDGYYYNTGTKKNPIISPIHS